MEPRDCPKTLVRNYHYSLHHKSEVRSSQLLCVGSLKSGIEGRRHVAICILSFTDLTLDSGKFLCSSFLISTTPGELQILYRYRYSEEHKKARNRSWKHMDCRAAKESNSKKNKWTLSSSLRRITSLSTTPSSLSYWLLSPCTSQSYWKQSGCQFRGKPSDVRKIWHSPYLSNTITSLRRKEASFPAMGKWRQYSLTSQMSVLDPLGLCTPFCPLYNQALLYKYGNWSLLSTNQIPRLVYKCNISHLPQNNRIGYVV
jgi:hypothetical protein